GLCFTANSLSAGRFRYGVPIKFQFRAILDSKTPRQAIVNDLKKSSICGNTIYGWKDSQILDVEDFFGHHEIFNSQKFLVHTNHPIIKKDQTKENTTAESLKRYNRAKEILQQQKNCDLKILKKILKDHQAKICSHVKKPNFWGATIASVIINPKEKWLEVCWSNPCQNKYTRYTL
ncbi:MAG: carcinine hydrolase/isopenicillin-N N-acyltransferase family protein, partial [Candidatus Buchananbacteria bacterium]